MRHYYPVLTIAGSDSSGGAGIQADIKTISAIGGYAMTAVTAITAQSTTGVERIMPVDNETLRAQISTTCKDITPLALKTGMLPDIAQIETIARCIRELKLTNVVIDPVMAATSGSCLTMADTKDALITHLFPLAEIVTPNMDEAIRLTGETAPERQAERLHALGCRAVLLKGGDSDNNDFKTDYLSIIGQPMTMLKADAVNTSNTHGTGCTLSAAIATYLAFGFDLEAAVMRAKLYVTRALEAGSFVTTGKGRGPVNHFFSPRRMKTYNPNTRYENHY